MTNIVKLMSDFGVSIVIVAVYVFEKSRDKTNKDVIKEQEINKLELIDRIDEINKKILDIEKLLESNLNIQKMLKSIIKHICQSHLRELQFFLKRKIDRNNIEKNNIDDKLYNINNEIKIKKTELLQILHIIFNNSNFEKTLHDLFQIFITQINELFTKIADDELHNDFEHKISNKDKLDNIISDFLTKITEVVEIEMTF